MDKSKNGNRRGVVVMLAAGTTTPIIIHLVQTPNQAMASLFTSKTELTDTDNANYRQLDRHDAGGDGAEFF